MMNKKYILEYRKAHILTTKQLKNFRNTNINLIRSLATVTVKLFEFENPPGASTEFNCNCRSNSKCCYNSDISGMQPRRKNSSTGDELLFAFNLFTKNKPDVGELFDHRWDSISTALIALWARIPCRLGRYHNRLFFQPFCAVDLFNFTQLQTSISGTLRLGKIEAIKAQLTIIGTHLMPPLFGLLLNPSLLFFNQYFNYVVPEIQLLWSSLIWIAQDLV
uniref:Uncharacterized protein n=1 Tax=Glossina palpalis gambiensis TaxID=67801 RepID=A0A1B0C1J8_9MUSC